MHDFTRDPVQRLVWLYVLIKHWFNNHKRKQNDCSSLAAVKPEKEGKGKSVIEKGAQSLDPTYVDRSFNGSIHLQENEVEIEDEWLTLLQSLIQHYNVCYGLKQIEC